MISPGLDVRIRRVLLLLCLTVAAAAAPSLAEQSAAPPAVPAPVPVNTPPPAMPQPVREDSTQVPSLPGYSQQPGAPPKAEPVPQPAPPPVLAPQRASAQAPFTAMPAYATAFTEPRPRDWAGSTYIPVDSWVYPAMLRLYSLGYLDTMFLSMRPYTRRSALHILQASEDAILSSDDRQAEDLLAALTDELTDEGTDTAPRGTVYGVETVYTRIQGISGSILQDSYHLGQTFYNDYGRPHNPGFNNITGFSTVNEHGPFSLYVRGEYQHAPAGPGYSQALSSQLASIDESFPFAPPNDPQATIPTGPIVAQNPFRLVEATLSFHVLGHEISGGKSDAWLSPAAGGAMTWSNNAENIYSFRINRVEPLHIKYVSRVLGPIRYDFFYGSLKGHTAPNAPWVHSEMVSFRPSSNFEFGFQRTIVFGGQGHEPVTLHTFFKGFFDINDTTLAEKYSRDDPGARFSAFNFSYRLPFVRNYLTLYADSEAHDDLTPVSAPRRAAYRPGLFLSHLPIAPRVDLRVEATSTDCSTLACINGSHQYTENAVQRQAYTNKGNIFGDWIGREGKGGQAWLTYHLSGNEWVQLSYMHKKTAKDFIAGGTTQTQFNADVLKRIRRDVELDASYQYEAWKAPIYLPGAQSNNTFTVQVTFHPKLKTAP